LAIGKNAVFASSTVFLINRADLDYNIFEITFSF